MDAKEFKRGDIEHLRDEAQNCAGAGVKWMTITERPEAIAELAKIALASLSDAAQATMPPLTDAMRAVLRNENCIYGSEDELYTALCAAADVEQRTNDDAISFIKDISTQKPEKPDYWSACGQCEHNIERAQEILESQGGT